MLVVDAGDSLAPPEFPEAERPQRLAKAGAIAASWALAGIDAVALGAADWRLGTAEVRRVVDEHHLPVLAANLTCDGARPYPASTVINIAGARVGIIGVTTGQPSGCEVGDPAEAVRAARAELGEVALTLLLAPLGAGPFESLVQSGIDVDLAFDARQFPETEVAVDLGGPHALYAGVKGKRLPVTAVTLTAGGRGVWPEAGEEVANAAVAAKKRRVDALVARRSTAQADALERLDEGLVAARAELAAAEAAASGAGRGAGRHALSTRLVEMGEEIPDHAATRAILDRVLASDAFHVAPTAVDGARRAPLGSLYAGADVCGGCHPVPRDQWRSTPHAHAWENLVVSGHHGDRECFSCHATGVGNGGPSSPEEVGGLRDVQCESCHGAGAAHALDPLNARMVKDPPVATCVACHDGKRDQGSFNLETYRPKVVHQPAP